MQSAVQTPWRLAAEYTLPMRAPLLAAFVAIVGCTPGEGASTPLSPFDTGATPDTGANDTGRAEDSTVGDETGDPDTGTDTDTDTDTDSDSDSGSRDTGLVAFDDCAGRLGSTVVTTKLVHQEFCGETTALDTLVVLADQPAVEAYWAAQQMCTWEPTPAPALSSGQAVAFLGLDPRCSGGLSLDGYYVDLADPAAIIASVEVQPGNGCDTGTIPLLDIDQTPIAPVSICHHGLRRQ
ncbi:hypothetical protein LBMAG42_37130 [Deltaproteobacteria bacterium]|nr:hypothetical protein LBMAG42_37130 [Deltaproteobacteria bacterium]